VTLARQVARNTAAQALGKAAVLAVGAASIAITTRYLGAAGYGSFALALALVQMLGVLADFGVVTVVVREISREPGRTGELVGNALTLRLLLGVVVVALAALLSLALPYSPDVRVAILIAGVPFVLGLATTSLTTIFQARLQMGRAAVADVAGRVAGLAALVAVVEADLGFEAVVATTAVAAAVTLAVTLAMVRVRPQTGRWRELLVPAIPLGLALAVNEIYFRADTFILSLFRPFAEVGHYTLAYRIFELIAVLPAIVMTSVFPLLSRYVAEQRELANRVLDTTADVFVALAAPIAAAGLVLAPELVQLVAGDAFAGAETPLRLLLCAAGAAWVSGLLGYTLIAGDRRRAVLLLSLTALAVNVALNLALVPSYGADAAAAVALGSEALLLAGGWILVRRELGLTPRTRVLWRALVAAAAMAGLLVWLRDLTLAVLVPAGAAVYAVALAALGGIDRRALEALRA
jgi:O-antigen/teichoic acid export membrane protein